MSFRQMNLSEKIVFSLDFLGYTKPTEVQAKVIPMLLEGRDLMVRSQTGTGKTAAFGIGLAERLIRGQSKAALVLTPTRELAVQVQKEIQSICAKTHIRCVSVYGGKSIDFQAREIRRGADIIVATPGRLIDLKERRIVDLKNVDLVVLDEADRMLDMGFIDDMERILSSVSKERVTCLFSATLDRKISSIAERYMKKPEIIEMGEIEKAGSVSEESIYLERHEKIGMLRKIQQDAVDQKILIFASTKASVDYLWKKLMDVGIRVGRMHGDLSQSRRESTLRDFKDGRIMVLVATDVAARGIHVDDIAIIINYDIARDRETHIHRVGRTGRMGKEGKAITFIEKPSERPAPQRYSGSGGRSGGTRGGPRSHDTRRSGSQSDSKLGGTSHGSSQHNPHRRGEKDRKRPEKKEYVDKGDSWELQMKDSMKQMNEE